MIGSTRNGNTQLSCKNYFSLLNIGSKIINNINTNDKISFTCFGKLFDGILYVIDNYIYQIVFKLSSDHKDNVDVDDISYKRVSFGTPNKPIVQTRFGTDENIIVEFPQMVIISSIYGNLLFATNDNKNCKAIQYWDVKTNEFIQLKKITNARYNMGCNSFSICNESICSSKIRIIASIGSVGILHLKFK